MYMYTCKFNTITCTCRQYSLLLKGKGHAQMNTPPTGKHQNSIHQISPKIPTCTCKRERKRENEKGRNKISTFKTLAHVHIVVYLLCLWGGERGEK